jgi:ABC-2 type transport system permease protein
VEFVNKFIADTDADSYYDTPYFIFPKITEGNDITSDILTNNLKIIYPYSCGVKPNSSPYITEKVLLTTSEKAIAVSDESEKTDDYNKYNLAVILEKSIDNDKSAKMFVSGTYEFINPTLKQVTSANEDFYNNVIQYFAGNESNIYIRAKNITPPFITLSEFQGYFYGALTIIIIPLAIIIYGLIVWMRRRHL